MKKNKIILIVTGLSFLVSFGLESIKAFASNSYGRLENRLILDMNFDKEIKNEINNKSYKPTTNEYIIPSSIKGKGYQPNQSRIIIPANDLNVSNEDIVTVSFIYKWGGDDVVQMLCSFGYYDIYRDGNQIGFNTGQGDMWGVNINPDEFENKYVSIVAEFNKRDMTKNKLYINGEKQSMSYLNSNRPSQDRLNNSFADNFNIGGWVAHNEPYMIDDDTVLDEFKIYRGGISDSQANDLANAHRIPELYVDKDINGANINWATEILPEDMILRYDFENGQTIPTFTWSPNVLGDNTGGQKLQKSQIYSGEQGVLIPDTSGGKGNHWGFPQTQSNNNIMGFGRLYFENGTKLSTSLRMNNLSDKSNRLGIIGDGGWGDTLVDLKPIILEDAPIGSTTLKVDRLDPAIAIGKYITSDRTTKYGAEYCKQIRSITNNPDGTYTLHVNGAFEFEQKKGDNVHSRPWRGAWTFPYIYNDGTNDFQLYNLNTSVNNNSDYNVIERGGTFYVTTSNNGDAYIDDLKFGYATEVEVFRDNVSLYKGYGSEFKDTYATDKTAPNNIDESSTNIEMSLNSNDIRNAKISFVAPADGGNSYSYQARAITKSGEPTPKTKPISINQTSGVKGYSYVIDKSPSTNPDNTVDTTSTSINKSFNKDESGLYYLHIKPIDNKGNVGSTSHIKIDVPSLNASPVVNENSIKLDWKMDNTKDSLFKVYKKAEGSNVYQSISLTDVEKIKKVKVLNIHPSAGANETFTTYDGELVTAPQSAALKRWMEEPKSGYPKGFGNGIIDVDLVTTTAFNANPINYLKDSKGEYKYDVVVMGFWDWNNKEGFNMNSFSEMKKFIESGRGFLAGHDTITGTQDYARYTNQLRKLMNIKIGYSYSNRDWEGIDYTHPTNEYYPAQIRGVTVGLKKKGLLTSYPHNIGNTGTVLRVPLTHSFNQNFFGDVWIDFTNDDLISHRSVTNWKDYPKKTAPDYTLEPLKDDNPKDGGTFNSYLSTWSNTAMIQTGHSNASATLDEQKIVANTIFYLNQLSSETNLLDRSSQDLNAPTVPTINSATANSKLSFVINSSKDVGSKYTYYVEAEHKNGRETTISNIKEATITTGVKGYSYVVDTKPSTIPDDTVDTTSTSVTTSYPNNSKDVYIHIKAIDNVGNISGVHHYKVSDNTKPSVSITGYSSNWINTNSILSITSADVGFGIDKLEYKLSGATTKDWTRYADKITVSNTGVTTVTARAHDKAGNIGETSVQVKIDKINPALSYNISTGAININGSDVHSGVKEVILPTGEVVKNSTHSYKVSSNGQYLFTIIDNATNKSTISINYNGYNSNTVSGIDRIEYKLSGATVKGWTVYKDSFFITNEGTTTITARAFDKAGNISSEVISTVKLDKTKPINGGIEIKLK